MIASQCGVTCFLDGGKGKGTEEGRKEDWINREITIEERKCEYKENKRKLKIY